jgi:long-chain acyl-CoA synthetase
MKQTRWVSQCVMHGDRRPYPVALITLDEEEIGPGRAERHRGPGDRRARAERRGARAHPGRGRRANKRLAQVEQVKKFVILDHDLSQETGELTPTLKVKRNIVNEKYADLFEGLYAG